MVVNRPWNHLLLFKVGLLQAESAKDMVHNNPFVTIRKPSARQGSSLTAKRASSSQPAMAAGSAHDKQEPSVQKSQHLLSKSSASEGDILKSQDKEAHLEAPHPEAEAATEGKPAVADAPLEDTVTKSATSEPIALPDADSTAEEKSFRLPSQLPPDTSQANRSSDSAKPILAPAASENLKQQVEVGAAEASKEAQESFSYWANFAAAPENDISDNPEQTALPISELKRADSTTSAQDQTMVVAEDATVAGVLPASIPDADITISSKTPEGLDEPRVTQDLESSMEAASSPASEPSKVIHLRCPYASMQTTAACQICEGLTSRYLDSHHYLCISCIL